MANNEERERRSRGQQSRRKLERRPDAQVIDLYAEKLKRQPERPRNEKGAALNYTEGPEKALVALAKVLRTTMLVGVHSKTHKRTTWWTNSWWTRLNDIEPAIKELAKVTEIARQAVACRRASQALDDKQYRNEVERKYGARNGADKS